MIELRNPQEAARWLHARVDGVLHTDSRKIREGDGFIAWPGARVDGRQYVTQALDQGAKACLVEKSGLATYLQDKVLQNDALASFSELKAATGLIAANYYDHPSQSLDVIAITGTNGKTSSAWWLAQALSIVKSSRPTKCGMVGTLGIGQPPVSRNLGNTALPNQEMPVVMNGLTTPDPVLLQQEFRKFVANDFAACAIEASSIGIAENRLDGTAIKVGIFTNFTQDHLDYHGSMDAYWKAKLQLFLWPALQAAVINLDDPKGVELCEVLDSRSLDLWSISIMGPARIQAHDICYVKDRLQFNVSEGNETHLVRVPLIGRYNVSNLLGVIAAMRAIGVELHASIEACQYLTPVPGRMECILELDQPLIVIDYAHTPDALEKALFTLREIAQQRQGRLVCIFGCGGNRDASKRPLMASIAENYSDFVVVTSDNSRDENSETIFEHILSGFVHSQQVHWQADRALAIAECVLQAATNDVILIAGKGHENYQEIKSVKHHFSDKEQANLALSLRVSA